MATYYLLNTVTVNVGGFATKVLAGELVDSTKTPTAMFTSVGGVLWASSDVTVAAAAKIAQSLHSNKAVNETTLDTLMLASAANSLAQNPSGAAQILDGLVTAPGLPSATELTMGFYKPASHQIGFAVESSQVAMHGDGTIRNLDPSQVTTLRYSNRFYALPINGVNESAALYIKIDESGSDKFLAGIYTELTGQAATQGPGWKGIHGPSCVGDFGYIAEFAADGNGWEVARFTYGGGANFISTFQTSQDGGTIGNPGMEILFCSHAGPGAPAITGRTTPQYGALYLNQSSGRAITIRKFDDGNVADGVVSISLYENNLADLRFGVFNSGETRVASLPSTSGSQTAQSPPVRVLGSHWNGSASVQTGGYFQFAYDVPGTPADGSGLRLYAGDLGSEFLSCIFRTTGLDLQTNGISNCASVFNFTAALSFGTNGRTEMQLDDTKLTGLGTTAMVLTVDNNGGIQLQNVTLGAADSGGTGFRLLRVPN
jgi:hypothetical protein